MSAAFSQAQWPVTGQEWTTRTLLAMGSALRTLHVVLTASQVAYLRMTSAQRHMSISQVLREMIDRDEASLLGEVLRHAHF